MIIALDVDGVIADCARPVHAAAERMLRRQLPKPEHWHSYDFAEAMQLGDEDTKYVFSQIERENRLGYQIELYPGARKFVSTLSETQGHDVYFLTAPWRGLDSWVTARQDLLRGVFPTIDVVFTHAKGRGQFDLLIDDRVQTVCQSDIRDRALLFSQPWNKSFDANAQKVKRVASYADVLVITGRTEESHATS